MKLWCQASLLLVVLCGLSSLTVVRGAANGGVSCAACSTLVAIVEQLTEVNNATVAYTLSRLCTVFPLPVQSSCKIAVDYLGPFLIKLIVNKNGPDVVCHALGFCYTDPGQQTCKTVDPGFSSKIPFEVRVAKAKALLNSLHPEKKPFSNNICDLPGIKQICELITRPFGQYKPAFDFDADGFSSVKDLRGSYWRGKDCSDISGEIHPGARPLHHDSIFDSNCNGIFGVDPKTFKAYEDELCAGTQTKGIAVLGDSISAHFHIPPAWLDATRLSVEAFKHLLLVLENEFDWPMMSTVTGYVNNTWQESISGPVDSIYMRLFQRNRCMHRDYQNIAVNGADTFNIHDYMTTLSRVQGKDHPLILALALVGNDICRGDRDGNGMTTKTEIYNNTLTTLRYLDKRLPNGSHVMLFSLVDGRILYDKMNSRVHPVGTYWNKFSYAQFYDFMNCVELSPCPTWLNSNETVRNLAFKRVTELNAVLKEIAVTHKQEFKTFTLHFLDTPIKEAFYIWEAEGGQDWQLIDPVDGFHTSQYGQAITAKTIWSVMEKEFPDVIGPINPNNDRIKEIFGDQDGL